MNTYNNKPHDTNRRNRQRGIPQEAKDAAILFREDLDAGYYHTWHNDDGNLPYACAGSGSTGSDSNGSGRRNTNRRRADGQRTDGRNPDIPKQQTSADRVGARLRKIRLARGLSVAQFGERIGLSADRVLKYENGYRRPKQQMLQQMADVLDVSVMALADPVSDTGISAMYMLFELEEKFGLIPVKENGQVVLKITDPKNCILAPRLIEWERHRRVEDDYEQWRWKYGDTARETDEKLRKHLTENIRRLTAQLNMLG